MPSSKGYLETAYRFSVIRDKLRRHPGPTLDFALGRWREPPPEWLPRFVEEHALLAVARRSDDELETLTRAAIEMFERVYCLSIGPDQVLVAPSGRAAMSALATVWIEPDDLVVVTEPGYPAFARLAAQRPARLLVLPLDPRQQFAPDLSPLDRSTRRGPLRLASLNYPNNPTGTILAPAAFGALRARLGSDAVVLNDATYGPLTFRRKAVSLLGSEYGGAGENVIELHSLGKSYSVGPLGAAFMVGSPRLIAAIREYGDFAWTQLTSLQVRVSSACLQDTSGYIQRRRADLEKRLGTLRQVVRRLGFSPYPVEAGMHLLCRAPSAVGEQPVATAEEAADALLQRHGLAVTPWDVGADAYLRFSADFTGADFEALERLGPIVE